MSAEPQISPSAPRSNQDRPRNVRWFPWTAILVVTLLFFGVYAVFEAPREIGRWRLAAANESWTQAEYSALKGDTSAAAEWRVKAFGQLEDALRWSPNELNWLFQRVQWKLAAGQKEESLQEVNSLMAKAGELRELLEFRSRIFQKLGRHAEAVKDLETLNNLSLTSGNPSRPMALNNLAYGRAVGKLQLEQALKEINEALGSDPSDTLLDTRGFVYYQMGKYEPASRDLEQSAERAEKSLQLMRDDDIPKSRRRSTDPRLFDLQLRRLYEEPTAVMLYHRSLVREKLGNKSGAEEDRKKVRELIGRDGDETLF